MLKNYPKSLTVAEIGEPGLLQRLHQFCPPEIIGDDAAAIRISSKQTWNGTQEDSLVVTTDVLVDGVHFSDRTTSAEDAGWRAAAANLSDLAAMGASPIGITVGLGLPGQTPVSWVEELYQGMVSCLSTYQTPILGGDVVRSPVITLSITALGQADPQQIIRRSTAQPGDAIVVTGAHGGSRAGLELLLHPELRGQLSEENYQTLIRSHQRPIPRLDILPILLSLKNTHGDRFRVSGMDSSDGLADAVLQIASASGTGAAIDSAKIPKLPALLDWVSPTQALEWALYGGEDFELVLCLPPKCAEELVEQLRLLGHQSAAIGTIAKETGVCLVHSAGVNRTESLSGNKGFEHFKC